MISQKPLFPYIHREKTRTKVFQAISKAVRKKQSQAIVVYGEGGVGKTFFVRHLQEESPLENLAWLGPYDVDDAEYWLLPNLEKEIAKKLDPKEKYFGPYRKYLSRLSFIEVPKIGHETVLAYLKQGDRVFFDCYKRFVSVSDVTPVLIFDTVEAIRELDLLPRLMRWMKNLQRTVFILASRPIHELEIEEPILRELNKTPALDHVQFQIEKFSTSESLAYLEQSDFGPKLSSKEKKTIVDLCDGYPLRLAMTHNYLSENKLPSEVKDHTITIEAEDNREKLRDDFLRRLIVPFSYGDFWDGATKRLGVIRRRMNQKIWQELMSDRDLPDYMRSWKEAWEELLRFPWVRTRANQRYVTLHDAFAGELAKRVIPLDDKDRSWRQQQWKSAAQIYQKLVEQEKQSLEQCRKNVKMALDARRDSPTKLVQQAIELDVKTMEFYLLTATALYYQMLSNYEAGVKWFKRLFDEAYENHQYRLIELLWLELQRFLPGEQIYDPIEHIVKPEIKLFQSWYKEHPDDRYEIEARLAKYLTDVGQPSLAVKWLDSLIKMFHANLDRKYELLNLRANAMVRLPGQAQAAGKDFMQALALTKRRDAPNTLRQKQGKALNELGYYYRNTGEWRKAAETYMEASEATPVTDAKTRADIQAQHAYVQALRGRYQDAHDLVETALRVREALNIRDRVGMALSVKGEVNRYHLRFPQAWDAYQKAEIIFTELDLPNWLGFVRQEMAICLFQASRAGLVLQKSKDMMFKENEMQDRARELALDAVDLCRDYAVRGLPSALNRAGRIISQKDFDQGLIYLAEGIEVAQDVADNWFYFANLIEYAELSYRAWSETKDEKYRRNIVDRSDEIGQARQELEFPDLQGRWELLQGHLKVEEALSVKNMRKKNQFLDAAMTHYQQGYPLIAAGYQASHGAGAMRDEMQKLERSLQSLPGEIREQWFSKLDQAWRSLPKDKNKSAAPLNANLTELYTKISAPSKE